MAQLAETFDPATAPESNSNFDLMPAGWYPAHAIEEAELATKSGNGRVIYLTWEVMEGPFSKRRIWQRISYKHATAMAQEIGQRELGDLCKALGLGPIQDTASLAFKAVQIRVGVEPAKDGFEAKNVVKGFKPYGGVPVAPPSHPPVTNGQRPPAPAAAAGTSRPWS